MYGHICRMGIIEAQQEDYPQALAYYEQSLSVKTACLPRPSDDPLTAALMADTVVNIAVVHRKQKKYQESISKLKNALKLYETAYLSSFGSEFALANTYLGLACAYAGLSSQNDIDRETALNDAMQCLADAHEHGLCYIPNASTFLTNEPTLHVLREHGDHQGTLQELIEKSSKIEKLL